jgi:hypothetical protein
MVTKKTVKKEKVVKTKKQYSIAYTIGSDPKFYVADGDDYKLSTIDVESPTTKEVNTFPVVFVIDADADTMEIIPVNNVGLIRHNFGMKAQATQFATEMEALKAKREEEGKDTVISKSERKRIDNEMHYG